MNNVYTTILKRSSSRLINLYDQDMHSRTKGFGDRLAWGWKVKDFHNATLQGGVHALAVGIVLGIHENEDRILSLIDDVIRATPAITTSKGSLQEAYPREHSFCVTALVAFDILSAVLRLEGRITEKDKGEYLEIVRPLIGFITEHDEEHAIISNHLATGVAAIAFWNHLTGENSNRHEELLSIIIENQSKEGWHTEYEGCDPGYETLCLYYLAAAAEVWENEELMESCSRAMGFLTRFAHPDSTIGGLYGSRNTEVYYPGGLVFFAREETLAYQMAAHLQKGIENGRNLLPDSIDIGNFIPLINSYAFAAIHAEKNEVIETSAKEDLPFNSVQEKVFEDAGIFIKTTSRYHAVLNYKKGGTLKVYDKSTGLLDIEDGGVFGRTKSGVRFSTQSYQPSASWDGKKIKTEFFEVNEGAPTAFTTVIIRLLSLTIFRSVGLGNIFKRVIVKRLMTKKKSLGGTCSREFVFNEDSVLVKEDINPPKGTDTYGRGGRSKAIHMASSGYNLPQHMECPVESAIVRFQ